MIFTDDPSQTSDGVSVVKSETSGKHKRVFPLMVKFLIVKTFVKEDIFHACTRKYMDWLLLTAMDKPVKLVIAGPLVDIEKLLPNVTGEAKEGS